MTLDEFKSKWITGEAEVECIIVNLNPQIKHKRPGFVHSAPLGDFLNDYLEHISIPWYRKNWDWKLVKRLMLDKLNGISLDYSTLK